MSESCIFLEAMNSLICIHMVKIIEVEKLEYAIVFRVNTNSAIFTNFYTIFVLKPVLYSVKMKILSINI